MLHCPLDRFRQVHFHFSSPELILVFRANEPKVVGFHHFLESVEPHRASPLQLDLKISFLILDYPADRNHRHFIPPPHIARHVTRLEDMMLEFSHDSLCLFWPEL